MNTPIILKTVTHELTEITVSQLLSLGYKLGRFFGPPTFAPGQYRIWNDSKQGYSVQFYPLPGHENIFSEKTCTVKPAAVTSLSLLEHSVPAS